MNWKGKKNNFFFLNQVFMENTHNLTKTQTPLIHFQFHTDLIISDLSNHFIRTDFTKYITT